MTKCIKKIISLVLTLVITLSVVTVVPISASAYSVPSESEFAQKIASLQSTFRHGEYWNRYSSSDLSQTGGVPCTGYGSTSLVKCTTIGYCADYNGQGCSCDCGAYYENGVLKAWQCMGFAYNMGYLCFGQYISNASAWQLTYSLGTVYAGDIIRINNESHSIFVYKVVGDTIYYVDCNRTGPCKVSWGNTISYSSLSSKFSYKHHFTGNTLTGNGSVQENYVDLGTDFYASIAHTKSWKYVTAQENGNVDLCSETYISNQYWKFARQNDGSYVIFSPTTGKCLDVSGGSSENNANVQVYDKNDTPAQKWYIYNCGSGYQLKPQCSDCVLEMNAWEFYENVNIVCGTKDGSDAEIFSINKRDLNVISDTQLKIAEDNGYVTFTWAEPNCATNYNIKIWNGNYVQAGEAPINIWNIKNFNHKIKLGEGTFTVYLETYNKLSDYHQCSPITFTTNVYEFTPTKEIFWNGHIYQLYDMPVSWNTAKTVCEQKSAHLLTINSQEEQDLINSLVSDSEHLFYNIGGYKIDDNTWKWITNEPFSYTHWAVGEPNNSNGLENYLSIFGASDYTGLWNDIPNSPPSGISNGFILEKELPMVESITLDKTTANLDIEKTITLTATILPDNTTDKTITWISSDTSVATVENGKVTGKSAGTAIITATTSNGKSASCMVTVNKKINQHLFGDTNLDGTVSVDDVTYLQMHLARYTDTDGNVLIDESDESVFAIADIDGNGALTISDVTTLQMILAGVL